MAAIDGITDAEVAEVRRRVGIAQQERIAALVALCEEVLEKYQEAGVGEILSDGMRARQRTVAPELDEFDAEIDEYRARLARLQGEG